MSVACAPFPTTHFSSFPVNFPWICFKAAPCEQPAVSAFQTFCGLTSTLEGVNECLLDYCQVSNLSHVVRALLSTVRIEYLEFPLSGLVWSYIIGTRPLDAKTGLSRIDLLTIWRLDTLYHRNLFIIKYIRRITLWGVSSHFSKGS